MEAIREQFNAAKAYVDDTLAQWTDPSAAVADETQRNAALRRTVERQRVDFAELQGIEARERLAADEQYRERKQSIVAGASGKLDALDVLSVAKMVYEEVEATMAKMADGVRQAGQRELHGYGYQSKMLLSIDLTLDAMRSSMRAGEPFASQLDALNGELNDAGATDAAAALPVMRSFASEGIASKAAIASAAVALASAVNEAHLAAADDSAARQNAKPTGDDEPESAVVPVVRGWLSMLRVETPKAVGGSGGEERQAKQSLATSRDAETAAAAAVKAAALAGDLDGVLARLPALEALGDRDRAVGGAAAKVRRQTEGRLLADLGIRFSDSMLTVRRFAFLEGVLQE
uniref:Uncharacterized protein n=1 Tax=Neobodo designis TaxID=312471 RepID=A0A7S1LMD7_NEODS